MNEPADLEQDVGPYIAVLDKSHGTVSFTVLGKPASRGSKTPWLPRHKDGSLVMKNGRPVIATMDSNKKSNSYMADVRQTASEAFQGDLLRGPVRLTVVFYFARPKSHFKKYSTSHPICPLKPSSPQHHTQQPDCDKLVRCLADGLTGIVMADDKQICELVARKEWTAEQERAEVEIMKLD